MIDTTTDAVIRAISYADVFSSPLTIDEIHRWAVSDRYIPKACITRCVQDLVGRRAIFAQGAHYAGTATILAPPRPQQQYIGQRRGRAAAFAKVARFIPTVSFIGISGSLAAGGAQPNEDIDLFIIARAGTLWVTRLLTVLVAELLGIRRRPTDAGSNAICLNMFIDERRLSLAHRRDVYTAHEILQLEPLFVRDNTYRRFLAANAWVRQYYANAWRYALHPKQQGRGVIMSSNPITTIVSGGITAVLRSAERVAAALQWWYMRRRQTTEVVTATQMRFHPRDARIRVLRQYRRNVAKLYKRLETRD